MDDPEVNYNTICPSCNRRYTDHDFPIDGWIDLRECEHCLERLKAEKLARSAKQKPRLRDLMALN